MTILLPEDAAPRFGRRSLLIGAAASAAAVLPVPLATRAQDDAESGDGPRERIAETPSYGGRRPGPAAPRTGRRRPRTYTPVQLAIPDAAVDAPVEVGEISQDGVMLDPSGAWVVSWYEGLGSPGEGGNVVMAGHLDYWDIPQAVFYYVPNLPAGSPMTLLMEDGSAFEYSLDWINLFAVADLTPEIIAGQIVGDTGAETLTLITCGGQFDAALQEYLYRYVIRATRV
ncbi:MAG: class F sortase [Chloroflexota bacterium]